MNPGRIMSSSGSSTAAAGAPGGQSPKGGVSQGQAVDDFALLLQALQMGVYPGTLGIVSQTAGSAGSHTPSGQVKPDSGAERGPLMKQVANPLTIPARGSLSQFLPVQPGKRAATLDKSGATDSLGSPLAGASKTLPQTRGTMPGNGQDATQFLQTLKLAGLNSSKGQSTASTHMQTNLPVTESTAFTQPSSGKPGKPQVSPTTDVTLMANQSAVLNHNVVNTTQVENTQGKVTTPTVTFGDLQSLYGVTHAIAGVSADGHHVVQVQVHPAGMGTILVSVQQTQNGVTIGLQANQMQVSQWLTENTASLQSQLNQNGVSVSQVAVSFGDAALQGGQDGTSDRRQGNREMAVPKTGRAKPSLGMDDALMQPTGSLKLGWQGTAYGGWV